MSLALVIAACGGGSGRPTDAGTEVPDAPVRTLVRLEVTPLDPHVPVGVTQLLVATGVFSDTTTQDLTPQVTWASDSPAHVTVSAGGVATAVAVGTATITARMNGVSATTTVTATDAVLVSIAVTPVNPGVPVGRTQAFIATGTFSDASTRNLTDQVTWDSASGAVAQISNADGSRGVATGLAVGTTRITASREARTGTTMLTVTDAVLVSIAVTPFVASVPAGRTQALTATGTFSDATTRELTDEVTWASSMPAVAQISNADGSRGVATGLVAGTTSITATLGDIAGTATLTVTDAVLVSIAVTPFVASVPAGRTQAFTATGTFSDATTRELTDQVTWASSMTAVAQISNADGSRGVATGLVAGATSITATLGDIAGTATLTVTDAVLVSIAVTPFVASVPAGRTQAFTATGTFSDAT
ncbi:MAG TPA: Ig-like domain-containing protein, partial [Kofleriaceae bacterium]|nr:Ig-like domain-containing protein [Kofleriaceae bacterium]